MRLDTGSRRRRPGIFHVGGARTALYNWALAKQSGGTFVLRIEDTDEARNQPEWTTGIIDALAWIGIHADDPSVRGAVLPERPTPTPTSPPPQRLYEAGHAYYCDLTPEQIQERSKASGKPGYDGYSRDRGARARPRPGAAVPGPRGWRDRRRRRDPRRRHVRQRRDRGLRPAAQQRHADVPARQRRRRHRDGDHPRGPRPRSTCPNTPKQQMLWSALGHEPPVWAHVPVLVNEQRKKLSKRRDKVALEQYRDEGYLADAMVNYLMTLGWAPAGRHRDRAVVGDRAGVPARGRHPLAGLLRPQEAGRVQRRLHPDAQRRGVHRR